MFSFQSFAIVSIVLILAIVIHVNAAATTKQDPKCLLAKDPGPCRMSLHRFYYNAQTDTCEQFTFGGCKGNDNKFGFKETCEQACKLSNPTPAPIQLQLKPSTLKTLAYSATVTIKPEETIVLNPTVKPQVVTVKH